MVSLTFKHKKPFTVVHSSGISQFHLWSTNFLILLWHLACGTRRLSHMTYLNQHKLNAPKTRQACPMRRREEKLIYPIQDFIKISRIQSKRYFNNQFTWSISWIIQNYKVKCKLKYSDINSYPWRKGHVA